MSTTLVCVTFECVTRVLTHTHTHTGSGNALRASKPQLNHSVRDWQTDRRRTAQCKHTVKINSHNVDHRKRQMSN